VTADEAAKAEAESIATRWVPAHMTARQGLVDDIAKAIVTERRLSKEARDEALREAADLVHVAAVGADSASGGSTGATVSLCLSLAEHAIRALRKP
jgi:hypothetical protein